MKVGLHFESQLDLLKKNLFSRTVFLLSKTAIFFALEVSSNIPKGVEGLKRLSYDFRSSKYQL